MNFFKLENKPIIFKIVSPIIFIIILIGGGFYYFNLKAVSDFAEQYIQRDILTYSDEIFNICDNSLTDILHEGMAGDEVSQIIKKGLTLDSIETYARQKDINILIYSGDKELLNKGSIDKAVFDIALQKDGIITSVKFDSELRYIYYFSFQPWQWQILIVVNPAKYSAIENKVRISYIASSLVLLLSILCLVWFLNKTIRNPINSIIKSLNSDSVPDYKGTKEIEFLSNSIKVMMHSLEKKVLELENKAKELRIAKEFNETILNSISDPIFILESGTFKVLHTNLAITYYQDKFSFSPKDMLGKTCYEIFSNSKAPCDKCLINSSTNHAESSTYERILYDKEGNSIIFEVSVSYIRNQTGDVTNLILLARDVTKRRQLEEQLRQSQKLESIGILSGGIAHDFNNILTAIIGYGNLLQMKLDKDPTLTRYVEQILKSSERAANLVSSLLAYSRKQLTNPVPLDINEVITKIERLLRRLLEENIELKTNLKDDKLVVMADPIQIEQILMNLATNARDAMPNGGRLLIETDCFGIDEDFINMHEYGKAGHFAMISISDTGIGIAPEVIKNIFDPFFTTKEVGRGTGLGLSTVYGIVKQHNGFINVYSEIGKGTTFKIYLPLIESDADEAKAEKFRICSSTDIHGSETILITEDEAFVREAYAELLGKSGYRVFEAADGLEALEVFSEHKDEIDIVLSDVIMPKKNGKELIRDIQVIKPDVKVLFMSGYGQDLVNYESLLEGKAYFISKPVAPEKLLRMIRRILDNQDYKKD